MTRDDIEKALKPMIDDFNGNIIKKQKAINKHIVAIERCHNAGVSYRYIFEVANSLLHNKIKDEYFKSLLFRAKKSNVANKSIDNANDSKSVQYDDEQNSGPTKGFFSKRDETKKKEYDPTATMAKFNEKYK